MPKKKWVLVAAVSAALVLSVGYATGAQRYIITSGDQIANGVIPASKLTLQARDSLKGDRGSQGERGPRGFQGSAGPQGLKGDAGSQGPQGPAGPQGSNGDIGSQGPQGPKGDTGSQGPRGPKGDSGVNSPLVFGPYDSSSQDSSVCGNNWANDTYTRTYIVTPNSDGTFSVTELFKGSFVTLAGDSPNSCSVQIAAGITGTFYGDYALKVTAPADFNFTASCPSGCTTTQFFQTFFNTSIPSSYAWEFYYKAGDGTTWGNTDHGNSGNIT